MSTIGFLGLGRMGAPMARRLLPPLAARGDTLLVHDLDPAATAALVGLGAVAADSAARLGERCETVFLSLPTPAIVREAVLGDGGILTGGSPRRVCDLSTSGPRLAVELAEALAPRGIASFDAPVSGGIAGAEAGTIAIMVGGAQPEYEATLRPLLEAIGKPFFMGEAPGSGQTMKLVNNLLGAVAIGVTAEGMAFGIKAGLDPARMIEVLNQSTGINSATRDKWPRAVLPRTFDFGFAAALSLKDTRLLLDEAAAAGVPLPLGRVVEDYLARTLAREGPAADFTAIAKVVEEAAGLDPERSA
jgi:3-hydroxyisobutyrate dehydrogenase-like beta-hydroxyacid dehydrogenase